MQPQKIKAIQGDSLDIEVTVKDATGKPTGLEGCTIRWRIAASVEAMAPIIEKTNGEGVEIVDQLEGKFSLALTPAETEALPAKDYFHAIRITFADGRVKTVLREYLAILNSV